jgi:PAS domain S-box-containing protein
MWNWLLVFGLFLLFYFAQSRSEQSRYRSIVEIQEELIICWSKTDRRIIYINPAAIKLLKGNPQSLIGSNFLDLIYGEDREWVEKKLASLTPLAPKIKFQCRIVLSDQQVRWLVWQFYLVNSEEVQSIGRDVTEQVLIEETLSKFEARNQALLESIPDSMFIVDRSGLCLDMRSRLPFLPEQAVNFNLIEYECFRSIKDRLPKLIDITLTTQQLQTLEFSYPDGENYYEMRLSPSSADEVMILVRDITDRKQAEAIASALRQEQEINQLQQYFFAMISHEFRTPLNVMAIAISALENSDIVTNNSRLMRNLNRIKKASDRILTTIDNMMTIYQIKTDFFVPDWQSISINDFCQEVIQTIDTEYRAINFYPDELHSNLITCPRLLKCILEQLLSNALKYSDGEVFLKVTRRDSNLEIVVSDWGIGIPEGEASHIFEPFFRGSNVEGIHGSGLGLSLVQKCVQTCQGTIDVVSRPKGGTTFRLNFPLTPQI